MSIFISHLTVEKSVADVLKRYLQRAYGKDFSVFVSSDGRSIPGGKGWFDFIVKVVKEHKVVLVLLSDTSVREPWINFEAGAGVGRDNSVIPIAIRSFSFDKLPFPLRGLQGKYVRDLEGILFEIDKTLQRKTEHVDIAEYVREMEEAEKMITNKQLIVRPVFDGKNLEFEIQNIGNIDIDLLFFEVSIPHDSLINTYGLYAPPTLEHTILGGRLLIKYSTEYSNHSSYSGRLYGTITPSMGIKRLFGLRLPFKEMNGYSDYTSTTIAYQIHARNFTTTVEQVTLADIISKKII